MDAIWIPGAALAAAGAHLTVSTLKDLRLGRASRRWPRAPGRLVARGTHAGSPESMGDSAATVAYEYEVGGRTFRSNRYDFAGRNAGSTAGRVVERFQVGDQVEVRYDPDDPSRAVLEPGVTRGNYLRILVAPVMLGAGLWLVAGGLTAA